MRKKISLILALVLLAGCCMGLSACSSYTDGAATTGHAFVQKLVAKDYSAAYDYIYSFSSDVKSRQDFIDRFENIYDALEVGNIALLSSDVTKDADSENEYTLTYSLQMDSALLGTKRYDYTAEIVAGPLGYTVIYDPSLILPQMEDGDKVRVKNEGGVRGEIFSADGKLLAKNDYAQSIYIDLDKDPDIGQVKALLVGTFGQDGEKIQKKYDNAVEKEYPTEVLATFPRDTLTKSDIEAVKAVNGLGVDDAGLSPVRYYPLADNAAHAVGYLGSPSEAQMEADDTLNDYALVGKTGIEAAYESTLRGTDGRVIFIEDDKGERKEVLYEEPKSDGSDVYLTLDTELQNRAYTLMASNCAEGQSGAVVALDYTNGDVKAMVSYPSFDPNLFQFPMDQGVYQYYEENQNALFSRATQARYMPGSTFKVFSAVPSIESGILDRDSSPELDITQIERGGKYTDIWYPNRDGFRWPYEMGITRVSTPDAFDYITCLKSSDNIFFGYWALKLGTEPFMAYMERIGMGEAPQFELPLAKSNLLNEGQQVDNQLLAYMGFGMGQIEITPVHLASMYTALMNGGDILNPTIVAKVSKSTGDAEEIEWQHGRTVFKPGVMAPSTIELEKEGLRRVVTDGTAYEAQLKDVEGLIAKTGTAQIGEGGTREVNWVIAIDPNTNLLYLVVVDTAKNEGVAPKLAILNGLVKPDNYDNALLQLPKDTQGDLPEE